MVLFKFSRIYPGFRSEDVALVLLHVYSKLDIRKSKWLFEIMAGTPYGEPAIIIYSLWNKYLLIVHQVDARLEGECMCPFDQMVEMHSSC